MEGDVKSTSDNVTVGPKLIFSVAEDRFLESLQLVENLPPEDSYTYFLAVLKNLGSFYMQFKKFDLTAPLYEKAYDVATKVSV